MNEYSLNSSLKILNLKFKFLSFFKKENSHAFLLHLLQQEQCLINAYLLVKCMNILYLKVLTVG